MGKTLPSKTTPKKKRPLNMRERLFVKALISGKCPTEAMREAGYSKQTADAIAGRKFGEVRTTIQALMEKRGLTDDRLLDVLEEGLAAQRITYFQAEGIVTDERTDRDLVTAHRYLETGIKLKGLDPAQKHDVTLHGDLGDRLEQAIARLKMEEGEK